MKKVSLSTIHTLFESNSKVSAREMPDHQWFCEAVLPDLQTLTPVLGGSKSIFLREILRPEFTSRESLRSHLTTSSIVLDPTGTRILLLFHKKIGEWIYPGGHADGDWFLLRSALRECVEETGLKELGLLSANPSAPLLPFFVQYFWIKAYENVQEHAHYDAVFAFQANTEVVSFAPDESTGIRWVPAAELSKQVLEKVLIRDGVSLLTAQLCMRVFQQVSAPAR